MQSEDVVLVHDVLLQSDPGGGSSGPPVEAEDVAADLALVVHIAPCFVTVISRIDFQEFLHHSKVEPFGFQKIFGMVDEIVVKLLTQFFCEFLVLNCMIGFCKL